MHHEQREAIMYISGALGAIQKCATEMDGSMSRACEVVMSGIRSNEQLIDIVNRAGAILRDLAGCTLALQSELNGILLQLEEGSAVDE